MRLVFALLATLAVFLAPASASAQNSCVCTGPGTCGGACSGTTCCGFSCTNVATDIFNCGDCGIHCGPKEMCQAGKCVCVNGDSRSCYTGPAGTVGVGACKPGTQVCAGGTFGACSGEVLPHAETCNGIDDNCDGYVDNIPGTSLPLVQSCYTGPPGTSGKGICHPGNQVCINGMFSGCSGEQTPLPPVCGADNQCTGVLPAGDAGVPDFSATDLSVVDLPPACVDGATRSCYDGPPGTAGVGTCHSGIETCSGGQWGPCVGEVTPIAEYCGSGDVDCDGAPDSDPLCPPSLACINGFCVDPSCLCIDPGCTGTCSPGYTCVSGACVPQPCPTVPCPSGQRCVNGTTCFDPCAAVSCTSGTICYLGTCVPNDCTTFGCPSGLTCIAGKCRDGASVDASVPADLAAPIDAAEPPATDTSGCGCRVGATARTSSRALAGFLLIIGLLLMRASRRRGRCGS